MLFLDTMMAKLGSPHYDAEVTYPILNFLP